MLSSYVSNETLQNGGSGMMNIRWKKSLLNGHYDWVFSFLSVLIYDKNVCLINLTLRGKNVLQVDASAGHS